MFAFSPEASSPASFSCWRDQKLPLMLRQEANAAAFLSVIPQEQTNETTRERLLAAQGRPKQDCPQHRVRRASLRASERHRRRIDCGLLLGGFDNE